MTWLRGIHPRPEADTVLVCFPHAAGSASFFRDWARELTDFDLHSVQYPGRGDRMGDPLPTDVGAAQRSDESIMRSLAKLGGTHAELLNDPLLAELVMPYVRADFVMFENYEYVPGPKLNCPVTAVTGDEDPHCTDDRALRWSELTTGKFAQHVSPGEHFYLIQHPPVGLIRDALAAGVPV
jgi:surfactin synthase thioesterase subunit